MRGAPHLQCDTQISARLRSWIIAPGAVPNAGGTPNYNVTPKFLQHLRLRSWIIAPGAAPNAGGTPTYNVTPKFPQHLRLTSWIIAPGAAPNAGGTPRLPPPELLLARIHWARVCTTIIDQTRVFLSCSVRSLVRLGVWLTLSVHLTNASTMDLAIEAIRVLSPVVEPASGKCKV